MSLKICCSDKVEDLAEELKKRLLEERTGARPFVFQQVAVPNTNISKWLQIRAFATAPSLCMGIDFPFIEQCLFTALGACLPPEKRPSLLPMNAYANGIASILLADADPRLAPFRRYISGEDDAPPAVDSLSAARRAWQLSVKLAGVLDKYEVHRRKIVENWLDERRADEIADPTERAEAALARKLFGASGLYPPTEDAVSLRQLFGRVKTVCRKPAGAARKLHFFGFSTLSALQADILRWLAQTHDIELYHNTVCLEYWGDIETEKERARLRALTSADEDIELDSPLLQNWGRAGRETLRLLVDLEEANGTSAEPIGFDWRTLPSSGDAGTTMLAKVQASVRRRSRAVGRVGGQDASIQIVGAPGIRREVEMVHNAILGAVWRPAGSGQRPWSDCTFSDIAVLVPDMKTYRPVIEAVFDARGQIPYGLIDTTAAEYSRYLDGFTALLAVAREGLSRETVFAVLDNACVQRALGFTPADVREWRRLAKEIGAFDGFEGKERFRNVSWEAALSRLRLGRVARERPDVTVWEGAEASALTFSEIVETLYRELSPLAGKRLVCTPKADGGRGENWADTLRRVASAFLATDREEPLEEEVGRQLFKTLYAMDRIGGERSVEFVAAAVETFVGGIKCQKGGYLTHGVTIAGLQPMRPVPFKQVFVLGMGEGVFPGRDSASTLEIRGAARTLGDMGAAATDRYLFLETLMAARERLVLSYPSFDIVKDAELFPSGLVCELEAFLEKSVLPERTACGGTDAAAGFREIRLPLLERGEADDFAHDRKEENLCEDPVGPIRWRDVYYAGILPTYSPVERRLARQIAAAARAPAPDDGPAAGDPPAPERLTLTAAELAEFLESPLRTVLRRRLGVGVEGYRQEALDPEPPLEMEPGPTAWDFQKAVLTAEPAESEEADIERIFAAFAGKGRLPETDGLFGGYSLRKEKEALEGDAARRESLSALRAAVRKFFAADGKRADPVRTLLPKERGDGRFLDAFGCGEILYTGRTADWRISGDGRTSVALVVKPCGDRRKADGRVERTEFPPKAVLEPLMTWLMRVADAEDETARSLRVAIADLGEVLCTVWRWTLTPAAATAALEAVTAAYLGFLDAPDGDGRYLDYGYSQTAKALASVKSALTPDGCAPAGAAAWKALAHALSSDDFRRTDARFNNALVIERGMEPLRRMPEERDAAVVRERFIRLFSLPLSGTRCEEWTGEV